MPTTRGKQNPDGTFTFTGVSGWENYEIRVRAEVVKGRPAVVALWLEPVNDPPAALTSTRMKALPLGDMAVSALASTHTRAVPELRAAIRALTHEAAVKHDPRAKATVEAVAVAWRGAYDAGGHPLPPRRAVMEALHMSARTADRYIARARAAGLLPPSDTKTPPASAGENPGESPKNRKAEQ